MASDAAPHFLAQKTIIVIGAGLSGLSFVTSLRKVWDYSQPFPKITVFDRDPQSTFQRQGGYSLSLVGHDESGGLIPLKKMDLLNTVLDKSTTGLEGGSFKLWNSKWEELARYQRPPIDGVPTPSIRISRQALRQTLLRAAKLEENDGVQWDSQCLSISKARNGRLAVEIVQGKTGTSQIQECDIVIAADGASSKIRGCLRPEDTLHYTGAVMRMGVSRFNGPLPSEIGSNWGFVLSGTGVSCFVSPVSEQAIQWAVGHFEDKVPSTKCSNMEGVQEIIQSASDLGSGIASPFDHIISKTDPSTVMCINAHDKLPFRHSDVRSLPVIFIGDSNHALSPFAGYGANLGLNDAWDLAVQLTKHTTLEEAVEAYDDISFVRATRVVKGARRRLHAGHSTGFRYFIFVFILSISRFLRGLLQR